MQFGQHVGVTPGKTEVAGAHLQVTGVCRAKVAEEGLRAFVTALLRHLHPFILNLS